MNQDNLNGVQTPEKETENSTMTDEDLMEIFMKYADVVMTLEPDYEHLMPLIEKEEEEKNE